MSQRGVLPATPLDTRVDDVVFSSAMDEARALAVASGIDGAVRSFRWLDFEVTEYDGRTLTVSGRIDASDPIPDVEIRFTDVAFVSLPMEWKTDTSATAFRVLAGDEARGVNIRFSVEQGHHIFAFQPEYGAQGQFCLVGCREIEFRKRTST